MAEEKPSADRVDQFILEQIETVPHLEALLLAWKKRPKVWSVDEMAGELYVRAEDAGTILRDLSARGLVRESSEQPGHYQYRLQTGTTI
jgi:predicted ArsR family transcriptional regulator